MEISCQHIAANCNPMPNALEFLDNNTIAYCFRNQVGLYLLDQNKVILNLNYRQAEINRANCLTCINENTIIVGYDSGHLIVYTKKDENNWNTLQVLKQNSAISLIHHDGDTIITNNILAEVIFYNFNLNAKEGETFLQQFDTIRFPLNKILESIVQITHQNYKLVFMAGTDQKIHCYTRQNNAEKLVYRFELSGHQNAITKLAITEYQGDYLLASSSKDGYIRLWRITQNSETTKFHKNVKNFDNVYSFLDAVLISHQSSVTNLKWVKFTGQLQLVSCSLDCTICVWGFEKQGSAWTVDTRMGQLLGNKNAYFNIAATPKYQYLVAVNYIGSALIWAYNNETNKFTLRPSFNGHTNEVRDVDWNHTGDFLVSVSKDQTTRILSKNVSDNLYHEISRAQIHGYDINAVSVIKVADGLIDLIACGADEKVIRIIQPPACFANYLNYSTKKNLHLYFPNAEEQKKYIVSKPGDEVLQYETYAEGGTQVLGLMTKVQRVQREKITNYYDDEEEQAQEEQQKLETTKQTKINFKIPPHDDYLVKHTLWPQMNKLYGHPHEISALAKSNKHKLLASSCEGKNKTFCTMIIWSTEDWKIKKMIQHHQYTVYGMQFSECGKYFASVSKDRHLALFDENFSLITSYEAHARATTCLSFSSDSKYIATGSRDKVVKIHSVQNKKSITEFEIKKQVHAITFCHEHTLAVGCIDGTISFLKLIDNTLQQIGKVEDKYSHTMSITKLRWKNGLLASCSSDHSVRIFKVNFT